MQRSTGGQKIAVVGSGIAGLAAAWLLADAHEVTLYEREPHPGGHCRTIAVTGAAGRFPVDMGFIVYNELTYPNLTALFRHLGVATNPAAMSFAVSLRDGGLEYAGSRAGLFAQRRNLLRPRFWAMLRDLLRFYRTASLAAPPADLSLGAFLAAGGYGDAFVHEHLLPMAGAIWSAAPRQMQAYPAAAFIRFFASHGLLQLKHRPQWRSVAGGSQAYVDKLLAQFRGQLRLGCGVRAISRLPHEVRITAADGSTARYDQVVLATHTDQALALLADAGTAERALLGAIPYGVHTAILHRDTALMPRRRRAWAAWNYIGTGEQLGVTYWMNRLQALPDAEPLLVSLNPPRPPRPETVLHREDFAHPQFDAAALAAQRNIWSLQGARRTWFCGAWCGAGFHEDALQAGLAVAESIGGVRRPWRVADESGRIALPAPPAWARAA